MAKIINITESELIKLIEHEMEQIGDMDMDVDIDNGDYDLDNGDYEDELLRPNDEEILSPEEIVNLNQEQILQLQTRVDYSEELVHIILNGRLR